MIRMGLFLYLIILTITSGLVLTGDLTGFGAFNDLSSALNQYNSNISATTDINGLATSSTLGATGDNPDYLGFVSALVSAGFGAIKAFAFLAVGSIEIIDLIDPSRTWGLIILIPIAAIQLFSFVFLVTYLAGTLLGAIRG